MCSSPRPLRYSHLDVAGAAGRTNLALPSTAASVVAVVMNAINSN